MYPNATSPPRGGGNIGRGRGAPSGPPRAPQPPSNNSCFPEHLSFLVRIENLRPDYSKQSIRHSTGCWVPPTNPEAYELVGPSVLLRWQGGRMGSVPSDVRIQDARLYSAATMFTQEPDTHHLLAVGFDARTARVHRENGWRPITFNHEPAPDFVNGQFYSFLSTAGGEARIAAPGSPSWMPQLLPRHYNYRTAADAQNIPTHAGLIGDLPLLFALAVFSAPSNSAGFRTALASIRPGGWHHHQFENSEGLEGERGVVVTIYLDPLNPHTSTPEQLRNLEEGVFGPFYGRAPA